MHGSARFSLAICLLLIFAAPSLGAVPITFSYSGRGETVLLSGDFNQWGKSRPDIRMEKTGRRFAVTLDLEPGSYRYGYFVDGAWLDMRAKLSYVDPLPSYYRELNDGRPSSHLTVRQPDQYSRAPLLDNERIPAHIVRLVPQELHVTVVVEPAKNTLRFADGPREYLQVFGIPVPSSNMYQTVSNVRASQGRVELFEGSTNRYVRVESSEPVQHIQIDYDITLYRTLVDWSKIGVIHPYDQTREMYWRYLTTESGTIDPRHPIIQKQADLLWAQSRDYLDYARRAFRWVIEQEQTVLVNSFVDYNSLDDIFAKGVRDCGASSGVLMSLLRNKGIPARNLNGLVLKEDARKVNTHVWVEFYLEGYGWIPLDPSYEGTPETEHFGVSVGDSLVLNYGMHSNYFNGRNEYRVTNLLGYQFAHWLFRGNGISGEYQAEITWNVKRAKNADWAAYFNQRSHQDEFATRLIAYANIQRAEKGLPALKDDPRLREAALEVLTSQFGNRKLDSDSFMRAKYPEYRSFGARWVTFQTVQFDLIPAAFKRLQEYLLEPKWQVIGIAKVFDETSQRHDVWIYFLR